MSRKNANIFAEIHDVTRFHLCMAFPSGFFLVVNGLKTVLYNPVPHNKKGMTITILKNSLKNHKKEWSVKNVHSKGVTALFFIRVFGSSHYCALGMYYLKIPLRHTEGTLQNHFEREAESLKQIWNRHHHVLRVDLPQTFTPLFFHFCMELYGQSCRCKSPFFSFL